MPLQTRHALESRHGFLVDELVAAHVRFARAGVVATDVELVGLVRSYVRHDDLAHGDLWRVGIAGVFGAATRQAVYEFCFVTMRVGAGAGASNGYGSVTWPEGISV